MKIFNKTVFALVLVVLAIGGAHLQNRKTKQYVYNDITLANLNAFMDSENNGSNPETGDNETESGIIDDLVDWYLRPVWTCKKDPCVALGPEFEATTPVRIDDKDAKGVYSWTCFTCNDLWNQIVNTEKS